MIYWIHRVCHMIRIPYVWEWHMDHHKQVGLNNVVGWHWNNLFLFNDTWKSTFDLWVTEILPTTIFCWVTGQWWIAISYYLYAAFVQERIEHNINFNLYPFITAGQWHMIHHSNSSKNFGLFLPIWDILFKTHSK